MIFSIKDIYLLPIRPMKKFFMVILLLWGIVLAGCTKENTLSQDEIFEKNKECANFKEDMEKEGKTFYWDKYLSVVQIFYSEKRQSCLYVVKFDYPKTPTDTFDMSIEVHDFLTKETLWIATPENLKTLKGE